MKNCKYYLLAIALGILYGLFSTYQLSVLGGSDMTETTIIEDVSFGISLPSHIISFIVYPFFGADDKTINYIPLYGINSLIWAFISSLIVFAAEKIWLGKRK